MASIIANDKGLFDVITESRVVAKDVSKEVAERKLAVIKVQEKNKDRIEKYKEAKEKHLAKSNVTRSA